MTVYEDAIDEMFAVVNNCVKTYSSAIIGYEPIIYWPGNVELDIPDSSKFWLRVNEAPIIERQSSIRCETRTYVSIGEVVIQLFCPRTPDAVTKGRKLARIIRDSYRKASGGSVTYRNHRINRPTPEVSIQQFTIFVEYTFYEEI